MSKSQLMEFKRGTRVSKTLRIPIADYVAGSLLWFTAKPEIDNDTLDSAAVIKKSFNDSNVTLTATEAVYVCNFVAADIGAIVFASGETRKDYVGEFEYVNPGVDPINFPSDDTYFTVRIYADVKVG